MRNLIVTFPFTAEETKTKRRQGAVGSRNEEERSAKMVE